MIKFLKTGRLVAMMLIITILAGCGSDSDNQTSNVNASDTTSTVKEKNKGNDFLNQTQPAPISFTDGSSYTNQTYGFVITPPSGWVIETATAPIQMKWLFPSMSGQDVSLSIVVEMVDSGITATDYQMSVSDQLRQIYSTMEPLSFDEILIGGYTGAVMTYTTTMQYSSPNIDPISSPDTIESEQITITTKRKQAILVVNDKAFTVLFNADVDSFDTLESDVDMAIASIRFE